MPETVLAAHGGDSPPVHFEINERLEIVEEDDDGMTVYGDVADSSPNEPWVEDITTDETRAGWHARRVEAIDEATASGWDPAERERVVWDGDSDA